jgi:hypothetical protein
MVVLLGSPRTPTQDSDAIFKTTPELSCFTKDFKGHLHPARNQAAVHYDFSLAKSN